MIFSRLVVADVSVFASDETLSACGRGREQLLKS